MTAIGEHVHPVEHPEIALIVDKVAFQGPDHPWLHVHDEAGVHSRMSAEDVVTDPDHRWRHGQGTTVCALLVDPHMGLAGGEPS